MNWFVVTIGILWGCGAVKEISAGHNALAIIYVCYCIASFALATIKV